MKILAIESSTSIAGVAVTDNRNLLGEIYLDHGKTHSTRLVPMINDLLRDLEIKIDEIDLFAVNIGPGSFTGLRIGITTVNTLGYALGKPVCGIYSTDILAGGIYSDDCLICPVIDARNNQVYYSIYKRTKGITERLTGFFAEDIDILLEKMKNDYDKPVFFPGDGSKGLTEKIYGVLGERFKKVPEYQMFHRAAIIADIAFERYEPFNLKEFAEPFYLRKSQAERLFDERKI